MTDLTTMCASLSNVERERLTMSEVGIDEALTIMDRRGLSGSEEYEALKELSAALAGALLEADGPGRRHGRLVRVRDKLTRAFPMTDADLMAH